MRKLPRPRIDDIRVLKELIAAKSEVHSSRIKKLRPRIKSAYINYLAVAPSLEKLSAFQLVSTDKVSLKHAYDVSTKPLLDLKERLFAPIVCEICPYCNIGVSSTLDHYVPKEDYAQFSVFSKNLVPCCSTCNSSKGTRIYDQTTSTRLFLHPYFDAVPSVRFIELRVKIKSAAMVLRFSVFRPKQMDEATFMRLESHFNRLDLANRFMRMSLAYLRDERGSLERNYGKAKDATLVAFEMQQKANDWEKDYGPNHWRVVLYNTLAADQKFCKGGFRVLSKIQ